MIDMKQIGQHYYSPESVLHCNVLVEWLSTHFTTWPGLRSTLPIISMASIVIATPRSLRRMKHTPKLWSCI